MEEGCLVRHPLEPQVRAVLMTRFGNRTDAKTVSIVALATFHPNTKVQSAALHFFLGSEYDGEGADESDEEGDGIRSARKDVKKMEHRMKVGKSARKKEETLAALKKEHNRVGGIIGLTSVN